MSDESGEVEMSWIVVPVQMSGETGLGVSLFFPILSGMRISHVGDQIP